MVSEHQQNPHLLVLTDLRETSSSIASMSSQADSSVHNPNGIPISTSTFPVSTSSTTNPTMSSQADSVLHNPDGTPTSPVLTTSTTIPISPVSATASTTFPVSTTSTTMPTTITSMLTMAPQTPLTGNPPFPYQQSHHNFHSPFPLQFPTNYPFSTSIPPSWTPPQLATTRCFGIDQLAARLHGLHLSGGFSDPLIGNSGFMSSNPPYIPHITSFPSTLTAPNVTNLVTVKLSATEDYLTWKTQFTALLISHNLLGFIDGSIPPPTMYVDTIGSRQINPSYGSWLRVDQSLRSWLFATLSRDILVEVHDLAHSYQIWDRLQNRFLTNSLARTIELKSTLTTL